MSEKLEILKKKLLYRASYRGTKEMDILLSNFVKKNMDNFDKTKLKALEIFLKYDDETILDYYNNGISNNGIEKNEISIIFKKFKI
tara:strand:- start:5675 stop:5932 length:258 start_codon:yes stop_codon:yes gene_type:complete